MALSRSIFVGDTLSWRCAAAGDVELGVVDASLPGVAEGISRLLVRSIQDARERAGGHLPGWLVDDIERNYISPEKVRTLWAATGHRFAVLAGAEIVGTVHVGRRHDVVLTADRSRNNVPAAELPGLKPERHHQVVNVSVLHELRRAGLAAKMFDAITTSFRHLFDGDGLWVRADPPWHPWLVRLGFTHDPSFDVFLPEDVERTSGLPHAAFNLLHACACDGAHARARALAMRSKKLQYVSFTRPFDRRAWSGRPRSTIERTPGSVDELADVLAAASREGRRVDVRGAGSGPASREHADEIVSTRALDRVKFHDDHAIVEAGATWRALLAALPPGRLPPVVPGYVDATVGGSLSTGGIGKGSVNEGLALDHVHELVVVTRDGRRVVCSAERDAWLFEAVLGGGGAFGAIAVAKIPIVPRRPRVAVEKRIVPPAALASALDVTAYHAFATKTTDGWLAIVARESDDEAGVPIEAFVTPPRPARRHMCTVQMFVGAGDLERVLAEVTHDGEITVHPIRRLAARRSLLAPRVEGATAYAVTITTPSR
jgi:hypothetical protein